jgi:magnesium-transporting ATPase (P-type)
MNQENKSGYVRFGAMIFVSMIVMYGVMYLNTYDISHVRWSETRLFMTLLMGATMAVIMLSFMQGMYSNKRLNLLIYIGSVLVFLAALFLVRSQVTVDDSAYMSAMIPHHSIAILTSERAQIQDLRVRELADGITETQRREIKEMEWLLDDISRNGVAATQDQANARPVPEFTASP